MKLPAGPDRMDLEPLNVSIEHRPPSDYMKYICEFFIFESNPFMKFLMYLWTMLLYNMIVYDIYYMD